MFDIIIAGGGAAGNYCALLLAASGFSVAVCEEHGEIGVPRHCTGIVSTGFMEKFGVPSSLVQKKLSRFTIFSPCGGVVPCPGKVNALVVDRTAFDNYYADEAAKAGALYRLSARVKEIIQKQDNVLLYIEGEDEPLEGRLCIAACGAMSDLPAQCGVGQGRQFIQSIQIETEMHELDGAELYLGRHYAPGSYAYVVSVREHRARIGVMGSGNISSGFRNLIESPAVKNRAGEPPGTPNYRRMPMGLSRNSVRGRVIALGDAAGQVKTTTGGGLYFAFLSAQILVAQIKNSWKDGNARLSYVNEYDRLWKKALGREIRIGLLLRKFLEMVSDKDLHDLCMLLKRKPFSDIVENQVDFDFHQHFLTSMIKVPEFHRGFLQSALSCLRKSLFH